MADNTEISLQDISDAAGVEIRTLRSSLAQDLLLPPLRQGRGAGYPPENLARARAIRAMRELDRASLTDIRRRLWTMSEAEIEAQAALLTPQPGPLNSAAAYLRSIAAPAAPRPSADAPNRLARVPANTRAQPSSEAPPNAPGRRTPTRTVTVFTINPDVELHVSGELPPAVRLQFDRIADLIRSSLKEPPHDQ